MKNKNSPKSTDADDINSSIDKIIKTITEEEDPDELNNYRKIIRKRVPLSLRSYFMTYLFKNSLGKARLKSNSYSTLFVSIGKHRRVFPNDLAGLFVKSLNITESEIGEIKIFDNYSFVDISLDYASDAISKLSGTNFHGKRITVSTARKKQEKRGSNRT